MGKKNILGLGMIEKTCETCNGIGYIEQETEIKEIKCDDDSKIEEENTIETCSIESTPIDPLSFPKKQRGRPKRNG